MAGFSVDIGALRSAMAQIGDAADQLTGIAAGPETAASGVAAAFPESAANGALLALAQDLGAILGSLAGGASDDVATLGQNLSNYLAADGSLT